MLAPSLALRLVTRNMHLPQLAQCLFSAVCAFDTFNTFDMSLNRARCPTR